MIARPESPLPLALLRVAVPLVIVISPELLYARALAATPERLAFVPEGLGLVARLMPLDASFVRALQVLAFSSAATAILGYHARLSMLVLTVSAGLVFSISQRQGAVVHDMHLFWMCALLAVSPCGDAWSLDAWGKPRPAPSLRYGVPLLAARILLGLVYFFPGFHKLRVSGLAWASEANVLGHLHAKWLEHGRVPFLRIDHAPLLCAAGGALVIAFELSFVVLALVKRTRVLAMAFGLAFHFSTQLFFFITFTSLWVCYAVLVPERWLAGIEARVRRRRGLPALVLEDVARPVPKASVAVGALLVAVVLVQGARGATQAWPFACYPTFAHLQGDTIPDLSVEITTTQGETLRLTGRERASRSQAEWGRVFRLSGAYGERIDEPALRAYAAAIVASVADRAPRAPVRIHRIDVPTAPERWSEPPRAGVLLTTFVLPTPPTALSPPSSALP